MVKSLALILVRITQAIVVICLIISSIIVYYQNGKVLNAGLIIVPLFLVSLMYFVFKNFEMKEFTDENFIIVSYVKKTPKIIPYNTILWIAPLLEESMLNQENFHDLKENVLEYPLLIKTNHEELYVRGMGLMKPKGYVPLLKGFKCKKVKILYPTNSK